MPLLLGHSRRNERIWMWATLVVAIAIIIGLVVWTYDGSEPDRIAGSSAAPDLAAVPTRGPSDTGWQRGAPPAETVQPVTSTDGQPERSGPASLIGRTVRFENARVVRVLSDRAFTVQASGNREVVVMLEEPTDRQLELKPGMEVDVTGRVEAPPNSETAREQYRGLSVQESSALRGQQVYVQARSVDVNS